MLKFSYSRPDADLIALGQDVRMVKNAKLRFTHTALPVGDVLVASDNFKSMTIPSMKIL